MTRIAYVAFVPRPSSGIERTLPEKAKALEEIDGNVDVIAVNGWLDTQAGNLRYVRYRPPLYPLTVLRRFRLIARAIDLDRYDAVILRYPGADASGPGFASSLPLITEHHTRLLAEMDSYRAHPIPVAERLVKVVRRRLERRYGRPTLAACAGIIGVTDEITRDEVARSRAGVPAITVGNGIDVGSVPLSGFVPFEGRNLDMVMLAGIDAPWNGIDRLVNGLKGYEGRARITLHVAGPVRPGPATTVQTANAQTHYHGNLAGPDLEALMQRAHLAVSSLAVHRKQMNQACALKTREYMARGLPFVIGHHDPDLASPAAAPFHHAVPADESPIEIETILDFAAKLSSDRDEVEAGMRSYAADVLDWRPKLSRYLDFCRSLSL